MNWHKTIHHALRESTVTWVKHRIDKLSTVRTDLLSIQASGYRQLPSRQVSPQVRGSDYSTLRKTRHRDTRHHLQSLPCLVSADLPVATYRFRFSGMGCFKVGHSDLDRVYQLAAPSHQKRTSSVPLSTTFILHISLSQNSPVPSVTNNTRNHGISWLYTRYVAVLRNIGAETALLPRASASLATVWVREDHKP